MKQFFFVDWELARSSQLRHTYKCGWRDAVKWRIALSVNAMLIIALLVFLYGRVPQRAAVPVSRQESPTVVGSQDDRSLSQADQQLRDDVGDERFQEHLERRAVDNNALEQDAEKVQHRSSILGNIGGLTYWTVLGSLGLFAICLPLSSLWRTVVIQWDGKDRLTIRTMDLWPSQTAWTRDEIGGIKFGLRERVARPAHSPASHQGWFWFIQFTGKSGGEPRNGRVLAELLVSHQTDAPTSVRARVPSRVEELLGWLQNCTGRRAHGPVLVADKNARSRILADVE